MLGGFNIRSGLRGLEKQTAPGLRRRVVLGGFNVGPGFRGLEGQTSSITVL